MMQSCICRHPMPIPCPFHASRLPCDPAAAAPWPGSRASPRAGHRRRRCRVVALPPQPWTARQQAIVACSFVCSALVARVSVTRPSHLACPPPASLRCPVLALCWPSALCLFCPPQAQGTPTNCTADTQWPPPTAHDLKKSAFFSLSEHWHHPKAPILVRSKLHYGPQLASLPTLSSATHQPESFVVPHARVNSPSPALSPGHSLSRSRHQPTLSYSPSLLLTHALCHTYPLSHTTAPALATLSLPPLPRPSLPSLLQSLSHHLSHTFSRFSTQPPAKSTIQQNQPTLPPI